jgi:hypothetical protein
MWAGAVRYRCAGGTGTEFWHYVVFGETVLSFPGMERMSE